jgi:uncharacterized protein (TIRG00374 family)
VPRRLIRGFRAYSSASDARRWRRPVDVVIVVLSVVLAAALTVAAPGPSGLDVAIENLLKDLPGLGGWLWEISFALLVIWPVLLMLAALARRGRRRLLGDYLAAAALTYGLALVVSRLGGTGWEVSSTAPAATGAPAVYLAVRLALASGVILVASPHLTRPLRHTGRVVLLLGALSTIALGVSHPSGAVAGLAVGAAAAAAVHLALGAPDGRLTDAQVGLALQDLDVEVSDVRSTTRQTPGVASWIGSAADGRSLLVRVYGRDAWNGQLLTSTWAALRTRGRRPQLGRGVRERVALEAAVSLLAQRSGVPVSPVVTVGATVERDSLIVTEVSGTSLAKFPADSVDDDLLDRFWRAVVGLHELRIAHRGIDLHSLRVRPDGSVVLADLSAAGLAAPQEDIATDRALLLVATAAVTGASRAVAAAGRAVGPEGLAPLLPFLQPAVLDGTSLRELDKADLAALRAEAVKAAGVDPPPLAKLRRVTVRSALVVALVAFMAYVLISTIIGVDFSAVRSAFAGANWWWLLAALLLSPVVQTGFAFATMGASSTRLRYGPVLMVEYAVQFIAVTLPSTAARLALLVRFFERFGIGATAALSIGVIDSVMGFGVQIVLIALIMLTGVPGLTSKIEGPSSGSAGSSTLTLVLLILALLVLGVVLTVLVPQLRRRVRAIVPRIRKVIREQSVSARTALVVLRSPHKVGQMVSGNFAAQVVQAVVLGVCLEAFGSHAHLSQLILINTLVSLFAGLMPVPGGMGVAEAGYVAGLQACGVPSAVAISTALSFRLVTFYLPPLWGGWALAWLRRRQYV